MRLLLLLLQHRQQHLVAQHCEKCCVRIGWHNALQDLSAKHPRMVKIKRSIKYCHLQFLTCSKHCAIAQLRMRRIIIIFRDNSQNWCWRWPETYNFIAVALTVSSIILDEPNTDQQMQSHAVLDSYNYTYIACAFWLPVVLDIWIYCAFWLFWHILTLYKVI